MHLLAARASWAVREIERRRKEEGGKEENEEGWRREVWKKGDGEW